ncbi:MAG: SpoIID/LytB domain-containing protein [Gaiella sp.]
MLTRPRQLAVTGALLLLCATGAGAAATAKAPAPVFVLTGGGWGHGVGMSQWGAYGQAKAGRTFEQILAAYYPGTTLDRGSRKIVRVLLRDGASRIEVAAPAAYTVTDADGITARFEPGTLDLGPALKLRPAKGEALFTPPLTITPETGSQLTLDGIPYRGTFTISTDGKRLLAVNNVRLESYLLGVVPGEMPRGWPLEALKAQAVAARTYAVRGLVADKPFDLHADWRSQVYGGVPAEAPESTRAVKETAGRILTYDGSPAATFYHSSSGGRTRSAADVFGLDLPYLEGGPDPWDEASPHHLWETRVLTGKALAKAFSLPGTVVDVRAALGADGRPTALSLTDAKGSTREVKVVDVRALLSLKSLSFRVGMLHLAPDPSLPARVPARAKVQLSGTGRDVAEPRLERQTQAGSWVPAPKLALQVDGTFTVVVKPPSTSVYRISGSGVSGPSVTVTVEDGATP